MQKKFNFIFFGAGPNQILFAKNSYKKNNNNIIIHNKKNKTAIKYSYQFFLGSIHKKTTILNFCKKIKIKIDDILCRLSGPSVISAATAFNYFKIKRLSYTLAKCIYSKYYFYKFLNNKNIPAIKSFLISNNKNKYLKGKWVLKPDAPWYGKMFVYLINNSKLSNQKLNIVKNKSDNKKANLSKYIPGIDVSSIFFIRKKDKKKILLNIINEWNFFVKNKMNIYNNKSVPGLSTSELFIKSSVKKKIMEISNKILNCFPDYYGLIAISFRVNNEKVYAYELNINMEKRYLNIIFPNFYEKQSIYDLEILNLMGKKLPKLNYKKNKKFVGILNNKKIVNKDKYLKKIKKYF